MKLANLKVKVRCDFGLCKNQAKYEIFEDGVLFRRGMCKRIVRIAYQGICSQKSDERY